MPSLDCEHAVALDGQQSEKTGGIGPCVDVDVVRSNIGFGHRGMTVHDELAEIFFTLKELIADPKQVFFALLSQRHAWPDSCVNKKEIPTNKA